MADNNKKTYAPLYVVQCDSMTGAGGQTLSKGSECLPVLFLNIDAHIAAGHILDKETHDKNVAAAKVKADADTAKKSDEPNPAK